MDALDTNVLLRYILDDDVEQSERARSLIHSLSSTYRAFIGREVILELVWVLTSVYKFNRSLIANILLSLIYAMEFDVEEAHSLEQAISLFEHSRSDLSDLLILVAARRNRALPVHSFDKRFAMQENVSLLS